MGINFLYDFNVLASHIDHFNIPFRDTDDSAIDESNTSDTSTVLLNDSCNESDDSPSESFLEKSTMISVVSDSHKVSDRMSYNAIWCKFQPTFYVYFRTLMNC